MSIEFTALFKPYVKYIERIVELLEDGGIDGFVNVRGEIVRVDDMAVIVWKLAMIEEMLLIGLLDMRYYKGDKLYQVDIDNHELVEMA